mmetsp:Transcript_21525/g.55399  ORF Transcript_21525/g.55399 Transcript_21525/m.55399 type:complete len:110 (-) Transcript_21525:250-579(-)
MKSPLRTFVGDRVRKLVAPRRGGGGMAEVVEPDANIIGASSDEEETPSELEFGPSEPTALDDGRDSDYDGDERREAEHMLVDPVIAHHVGAEQAPDSSAQPSTGAGCPQ